MSTASIPPGLFNAVARKIVTCPVCASPFEVRERSLVCPSGHCFDVARQGHVHLAPGHKAKETYDRALMQARGAVVADGFFDALSDECARALAGVSGAILDAGCGEGSFLARLCSRMGTDALGVGIDLAPEGVRMAAARSKEQAWCVADLAAIPVMDRTFSALVNVLSPANFREFQRVLVPGGVLVKVLPTSRHLRELRLALGRDDDYSNQPVADQFRGLFPNATTKTVETDFRCHPGNAGALLGMTPLGWHATDEQRRAFTQTPPQTVTVSFEMLTATVG